MPIVCGTDLQAGGAAAISAAAALAALREEHELIVVHIVAEEDAGSADDAARSLVGSDARVQLEAQVAKATQGFKLSIRTDILIGPVVAGLISVADTEGAQVIVVAARSQPSPAVGASRLGSTAERVISAAAVPVLVIRDAAPFVAWAKGERPLRALVAVDDSATADAAVALVKTMRGQRAIDVVLGTAYYADEAARHFGLSVASAVEAHPEVERLLVRDLMRRFGVSSGQGDVVAHPIRALGRIGDHILELADREHADVIVAGTHQKTGLGRLGSVSAVIAHSAKQSVLCVPPTTQVGRPDVPTFAVAVVATDLSAFGNRAVPYAYALVGAKGEVHIVHVREDDPGEQRAALEHQLLALAPSGTIAATRAHILVGDDPAELIAETAARVGGDAVVIASHGRSGITRALVGSVADRLLRHTRLPVLVLRPKT
jgi:nucleotide-binding universal stress UspA family protein